MYSRQSGLMLSVLNPGWSEWLCFLQQVNTSARLKVRWCKKTDLILPQAHLTQSIFPIQSVIMIHPSRKKYRVPSISAHHFLTWVQTDWSSIFLSFWTLFLLYWCGFSESAWKRTRYWIHPDISMHILHTGIYEFSKVLTRRICLIKELL